MDAQPDEEAQRRQGDRERQQHVLGDCGADAGARIVLLADLDHEAMIVVPGAEDPPRDALDLRVAEAFVLG
jgi:hypothetical protein